MIAEETYDLFKPYLPAETSLLIEESTSKLMPKYVYRLTYTSKTSGRTMCVVAKGDLLPVQDDYILMFYVRQLVLTPTEAAREFSRVYFFERRARQDAFLFEAGKSKGGSGKEGAGADYSKNIRIAGKTSNKDQLDGALVEDRILLFKDYIG